MCKIMTWSTYRKSLKDLRQTRDSSKGWAVTTVEPTMVYNGFTKCIANDIDMDERKPKRILLEDFQHIVRDAELIVYFVAVPTGNYAGYYKYLDIYYKTKKVESQKE